METVYFLVIMAVVLLASSDVRHSLVRFLTPNPMNEDLNIFKYKTVGEFYEDANSKGYKVTTTMCHGLSQLMKIKKLTFLEAYSYLLHKQKITLEGKTYIYDLSADKLWQI